MNIKYNKKKQEMREDPVISAFVKAKELLTKNSTTVIGVLVVLLFILGGLFVFNRAKETSIREAQELFGMAMIQYNGNNIDEAIQSFGDAANGYSHTPQGSMSAFMLGNIYYSQKNYDEAVKWFGMAVSNRGSTGFVGAQALVGLAVAYEALGETTMAINTYQKALRDNRIAFKHPSVRWKLALLARSEDPGLAGEMCRKIIADSSAVFYHQHAQNLLATFDAAF